MRCLWESVRKFPSPVACWTTSRLDPFPPDGSASIAWRSETSTTIRTSTSTIEPVVRIVRSFLRKTLRQTRWKNFTSHPLQGSRSGQLLGVEDSLVEMDHAMGAAGCLRIVSHHHDRLVELAVQPIQELQNLVG